MIIERKDGLRSKCCLLACNPAVLIEKTHNLLNQIFDIIKSGCIISPTKALVLSSFSNSYFSNSYCGKHIVLCLCYDILPGCTEGPMTSLYKLFILQFHTKKQFCSPAESLSLASENYWKRERNVAFSKKKQCSIGWNETSMTKVGQYALR